MPQKSVAIQGYEGSFHHIVARDYFGRDARIDNCNTFRDVAHAVSEGKSDYGVMAIENSIGGSILPNYGILHTFPLQVMGEYYLNIKQNLMVLPGVKLEDIEEVHSHQMALLQCMDYLDRHNWKLVETADTASSARNIAQKGLRNVAAIAGTLPAELYGLEIIAPEINTIKNNSTRFLIVCQAGKENIPTASNKATLSFKTDHKQGSLLKVLNQMENTSINLTKLQSSPIPDEPWRYMFHIDMEFDNISDYKEALENIKGSCEELCVYGVYKKGLDMPDAITDTKVILRFRE